MQGRVKSACTQCHRVANITKQHLSRAAWTKTIDKMIGYGAEVDEKDKAALIDYLTTHFGPGNLGFGCEEREIEREERQQLSMIGPN